MNICCDFFLYLSELNIYLLFFNVSIDEK